MLEIRPICENCGKKLPNESTEAMVCSYECTFCADCVSNVLHNVCPNCGGGIEKRPNRPKEKLQKDPATAEQHLDPIDLAKFEPMLIRYRNIKPNER